MRDRFVAGNADGATHTSCRRNRCSHENRYFSDSALLVSSTLNLGSPSRCSHSSIAAANDSLGTRQTRLHSTLLRTLKPYTRSGRLLSSAKSKTAFLTAC